MSVVSYQDLPLAPRERPWDSAAAVDRIKRWAGYPDDPDWAKYRKGFLWWDSENPSILGSYALPIADVIDGRLTAVPRGIFAAANAVSPAREGGPRAFRRGTAEERDRIRANLVRYYAKMRREFEDPSIVAPWEEQVAASVKERFFPGTVVGASFGKQEDTRGYVWKVVVAEAGPTLNGVTIHPDALRNAVDKFEGIPVQFFKIGGELDHLPAGTEEKVRRTGGAFGNLAGYLRRVRFEENAGSHGLGRLVGNVVVVNEDVRKMLLNLQRQGLLKKIGLSFVARGKVVYDPRNVEHVLISIVEARSVDGVDKPAAGGRFERLVASINLESENRKEESRMNWDEVKERLSELIAPSGKKVEFSDRVSFMKALAEVADMKFALQPAVLAAIAKIATRAADPNVTSEEILAILDEAKDAVNAAGSSEEMSKNPESNNDRTGSKDGRSEVQVAESDVAGIAEKVKNAVLAELKKNEVATEALRLIENSRALNPAGKEILKLMFSKNPPSSLDEVRTAIRKQAEACGYREGETVKVEMGTDPSDAVMADLLYFLGDRGDDVMKAARVRPISLHKVFSMFGLEQQGPVPGDLRFSRESATIDADLRFSLTTTTFPKLLGDAMNRRLQRVFVNLDDPLAPLFNDVAVSDFRQQRSVRFDFFDDLKKKAAEDGQFPDTTVAGASDRESVYSADERGLTVSITRKVRVNDDVRLLREIPVRLARAARRTLVRYRANILIGDDPETPTGVNSTGLYSAPNANLITDPLSYDSLLAARTLLRKQTEEGPDAAEMNLAAFALVVPTELEGEAFALTQSDRKAGTDFNDANIFRGLRVISVPTGFLGNDANNWYLTANPQEHTFFEIGFVNDQREPTIVLDSAPTSSNVVLTGNWTYVVSFDFGGTAVDHRGVVGAIVP